MLNRLFSFDKGRYERKFVIDRNSFFKVKEDILLNKYGFKEIYYKRQVNNIYFDDFKLSLFNHNVNGINNRFKVRIRWYGIQLGEIKDAVLEIKIKRGLVGMKLSYKLKPFYLKEESISDSISNSKLPGEVYEMLKSLFPVLYNCYQREYFLSFDKKYRITLDSDLNYLKFGSKKMVVDNAEMIMEIKYEVKEEENIGSIGRCFSYRLSKSSKYIKGVMCTLGVRI